MHNTLKKLDTTYDMQKAKTYHEDKTSLLLYTERKEDGHRIRLTSMSGQPRLHTRGVDRISGFYHYIDFDYTIFYGSNWRLPPETILDGELIWPGHPATDVATALKECPEKLQIKVFSAPILEGIDLRWVKYKEGLDIVLSRQIPIEGAICGLRNPSIDWLKEYYTDTGGKTWGEGFVLKEMWYCGWWKWKPVSTYDCVVTGIIISTAGKYKGYCKSLKVSVWIDGTLRHIGNASGMKELIRYNITKKDIGRVVEVKSDGFTSKGKLKFPRFVRWRDDKTGSECVLKEQL